MSVNAGRAHAGTGINAAMFNSLRKLIAEMGEGGKHPSRFGEDDYRLAASALLVHAAAIDGSVTDAERAKLHAVIKQRFSLDDAATDELVAEATAAEQNRSIFIISPPGSTGRSTRRAARVWSK